jgi:DNA repair photolyase
MSERLAVKSNAVAVLEKQLAARAKKNQRGFVVLASATDPYISIEEKYEQSREFLKLFLKYQFPVHVITKSKLIERDFDLLHQIDAAAILPNDLKSKLKRGVIISFSLSTLDEKVALFLESGAPLPNERLQALKKCKEEGFLTGVNAMPLLPYISDTNEKLKEIFDAVKNAGADYLLAAGLTLFGNEAADSKTLYFKFIEKFYPQFIPQYQNLFGNSFYVARDYQSGLQQRLNLHFQKFDIRNSII